MKLFLKIHRRNLLLLISAWVVTTIPFVSRTPFSWDAAQFTLAVEHFSLQMHQPHPPGYPLFVGLAKLFALVLPAHTSVLIVSLLFSLATVVTIYILVWQIWAERSTAFIIAIAFLLNPLFWVYREVALTYTVDTFAISILMLFSYRTFYHPAQQQRLYYLYSSSIVLSLLAGFRPSLLVLLLPIIILQWIVWWLRTKQWKPLAFSLVFMTIAYAVWFIPLTMIVGGVSTYLSDSRALYHQAASVTSGLYGAPWHNTWEQTKLVFSTVFAALNILVVVLLGSLAVFAYNLLYRHSYKPTTMILWIGLVAILGPLGMYTLIHFGQIGYATIFLPVVYLALVPAIRWLFQHQRDWVRYVSWLGVTIVFGINAAVFLVVTPVYSHPDFFPHTRFEGWMQTLSRKNPELFKMNAALIESRDARIQMLQAVIQEYDPSNTVIITTRDVFYPAKNGLMVRNDEIFRELSAVLPEYRIYQLGKGRELYLESYQYQMEEVKSTLVDIPDNTRYIIWAVDGLTKEEYPNNILIEQRTIQNQSYYFGIMERSLSFLDFSIQRPRDSR